MQLTSRKSIPLKVGFWTPFFNGRRGNSTTAKRIINGLREHGVSVEVYAYEEENWDRDVQERMESCDLYHILHFFRFSSWEIRHQYHLNRPYIVSSGGTDVNENMLIHAEKEQMKQILRNAEGITVFTKDAMHKLRRSLPFTDGKVTVIPQSAWLPEASGQKLNLETGYPNILLPAGLRDVKDVFYLFEPLTLLVHRYPRLKFTIIGEPLDDSIHEKVLRTVSDYPWFNYLNSVPLETMNQLYEWSDLVVNSSRSEGQPLSLIEAMTFGVPIIARKNSGNESLIEEGVNGLLFSSPEQFTNQLTQIMDHPQLYNQMAKQACSMAKHKFNQNEEIRQYVELYQLIMR